MLVGVSRDQDPVGEVLRPDQLGHVGEVLGVADVLLREGHPAVGPLLDRVGLSHGMGLRPRDVDLQQLRH